MSIKIYDCIPFFNEIDILNLRLHILDPYVDRFVIEESTTTFSGQPKELCFEQNKELFRDFLHKITYVVVRDDIKDALEQDESQSTSSTAVIKSEGKGLDGNRISEENSSNDTNALWRKAPTHARDVWQKNHLIYGLKDVEGYVRVDCTNHGKVTSECQNYATAATAQKNDIVIFGDCDEIPNPEALEQIISRLKNQQAALSSVFHLRQRNFYAFLNMEEQSGSLLSVTGDFPEVPDNERQWLGTKVTTVAQIPAEGIDRLRDLVPLSDPRSVRVDRGGWHFGYMGGHHETNAAKRIGVKVKAAAHQEYNDREILAETMDHLYLGHDIFGRSARFVRVPIDDSYPSYLREHQEEYSYLIMPPISAWIRLRSQLDLTVGRFCRKAWRHVMRRFSRQA